MTIFKGYHNGVRNNQVSMMISMRFPTSRKNTFMELKKRHKPMVKIKFNKITWGKKRMFIFMLYPKMMRNGMKTTKPNSKLIRLDKILDIGKSSLGK